MQIEEVFPQTVFEVFGIGIRDTLVVTWGIMLILAIVAWLSTRRLVDPPGRFQNAAESVIESMQGMISQTSSYPPERFLPFIGTLAVFLVLANSASMFPGVGSPTKDVSTTSAIALVVFLSVHYYAARIIGPKRYLKRYIEPHWLLLPFNIIGEVTRTVALSLRLFGNILSGELIVAVLFVIAGLLVPVPLQILGLLIGVIQAYVFTLLALVYIAAALQTPTKEEKANQGGTS